MQSRRKPWRRNATRGCKRECRASYQCQSYRRAHAVPYSAPLMACRTAGSPPPRAARKLRLPSKPAKPAQRARLFSGEIGSPCQVILLLMVYTQLGSFSSLLLSFSNIVLLRLLCLYTAKGRQPYGVAVPQQRSGSVKACHEGAQRRASNECKTSSAPLDSCSKLKRLARSRNAPCREP